MPKLDGFQRWRPLLRRTYLEAIDSALKEMESVLPEEGEEEEEDLPDGPPSIEMWPRKCWRFSVPTQTTQSSRLAPAFAPVMSPTLVKRSRLPSSACSSSS